MYKYIYNAYTKFVLKAFINGKCITRNENIF